MDAKELLIRQAERQVDALFRAARAIPADKLDWQPAPGTRSALDQLQEIATAADAFWNAHAERKMEWDPEAFAKWQEERGKMTDLDQLERHARESHARVYEFIRGLDESQLDEPVEMPFPGEYRLADIFAYYFFNASYHEGQINLIANLLPKAEG